VARVRMISSTWVNLVDIELESISYQVFYSKYSILQKEKRQFSYSPIRTNERNDCVPIDMVPFA